MTTAESVILSQVVLAMIGIFFVLEQRRMRKALERLCRK